MTTWAELLSDARNDLMDTGATPRWSNEVLYLYTKDGIRDYSLWFPKRIDRLEVFPSGDAYPLPVNYIQDIHVECPKDKYLERREVRPGSRRPTRTSVTSYYLQGGSLYLNSPLPDTPIYLTYFATHPVPASKDDDDFVLTVPDADIELLRLFLRAKTYGQMRGKQAALDRFKPAGKRDDNPLEPETDDLWAMYYRRIAERISGGVINLYRLGRGV
jgi:hypothetical protein